MTTNNKEYGNFINNFGDRYQEAIVGHMFKDTVFLIKCYKYVETEWFTNHLCGDLVKEIFLYYLDNQTRPNDPTIIIERLYSKHLSVKENEKYKTQMMCCINSANSIPLNDVQSGMNSWIKMAIFKTGHERAANKYNQREIEEAVRIANKTVTELQEINFNDKSEVIFTDSVEFCKKVTDKKKRRCTLGTPMFDSILVNDASTMDVKPVKYAAHLDWVLDSQKMTNGSLFMGDSTCIVGSTNAGKTRTLITIIVANIVMGKYVLYVTLEQTADDIKQMLLMSMTGYNAAELSSVSYDLKAQERVRNSGIVLQEQLTYIPHLKIKLIAEEVLAIIDQKQRELKDRTGHGYDLVVIDYPAKCKSEIYFGKSTSSYEEKKYIYQLFIQSALVNDYHVILPVQTNRDGYKVNRGDARRMIDVGDVSESFGITQEASNVITLNRDTEDVKNDVITYFVSKCRSNKTGHAYMSETRMDIARTHHISLVGQVLEPGISKQEAFTTIEGLRRKRKEEANINVVQINPEINRIQQEELKEISEQKQTETVYIEPKTEQIQQVSINSNIEQQNTQHIENTDDSDISDFKKFFSDKEDKK